MKDAGDRDLVERAAAGEESAWREIYDRTRYRLFALLSYHLGNREDALDVLQDTYVDAIRCIGGFRGEGSLEGWLATIAIRRSIDWKRRFLARMKQTVPFEPEKIQVAASDDPPEVHFSGESRRLREGLAQLSSKQRTALLLRELEGFSFAEVGEALSCNEATARVHHHRARARLQSLLSSGDAPTEALYAEE